MRFDWAGMLVIAIAIVVASLVEHTIIAPKMAHNPVDSTMLATPYTAADYVKIHFPNAVTV